MCRFSIVRVRNGLELCSAISTTFSEIGVPSGREKLQVEGSRGSIAGKGKEEVRSREIEKWRMQVHPKVKERLISR